MTMWLKNLIFILSIILISFSVPSLQSDDEEEKSCSADMSPSVRCINDFGFQLTKRIQNSKNLFISPFSIFAVLALTLLGANGNTAKQMVKALQLPANDINGDELPELYRELNHNLQNSQNGYQLLIAAADFIQHDFFPYVKRQFIDDAFYYYDAPIQFVDFARNGKMAMEIINDFVASRTNDLIPEFLKEPLDRLTKLALLNAIYFKGTWTTKFPKNMTKYDTFYLNGGGTKRVEMMRLNYQPFPYYEDEEYKYLELPYDGDDVSMLLILPQERDGIPNPNIDSYRFSEILESLRTFTLAEIYLPKWRLRYRNELSGPLKQMGIRDLFSRNADLSGISDKPLKGSVVLHEAIIEVNEEGTKAAAVTEVPVGTRSILYTFVANHPFWMYIVHKRTGLVLFSGQMYDPSGYMKYED